MNLAQAKGIEMSRIVKSMLANHISWKAFDEFKEPLRTELKRKYREDRCIVVVAVKEDADVDDPVCAVGLLKMPGAEDDSSDYGSDDETSGRIVTDEDIDYDIGVMVVNIKADDNSDDDEDGDDDAGGEGGASGKGGARKGAGGKGGARKGAGKDVVDDDDGDRKDVGDDAKGDESDDDSDDDNDEYDRKRLPKPNFFLFPNSITKLFSTL